VGDERLIVSTEDCRLILYENGEPIADLVYTNEMGKTLNSPITALVPISSGVICGSKDGLVFVYEKVEEPYYFRKSKEIFLEENEINALCISPAEDSAVCTLKNNQIYSVSFSGTDSLKVSIGNDKRTLLKTAGSPTS
jgi:hypothetical protein